MADRLKEIPAKLLAWWNKYTSKQKTIIISIAAGVVLALAILVTVLTRPQYELLVTCESTKESAAIIELLEGASPAIDYVYSEDGYQIKVEKSQVGQANVLLGANNIPTVRIIHGKGTGALKAALWRYFKTDRRIKSYRHGEYGEGDAGVTVITLG